jgi:hypothetical protein
VLGSDSRVPCGAGGPLWGVRVDENETTRFILQNRFPDSFSVSEGVASSNMN